MSARREQSGHVPWRLHDIATSDPEEELVDRSGLNDETISEIDDLMAALVDLRRTEDTLRAASERYMHLNSTDMRALHFLIAAGHRREAPTAAALAAHLEISSASTTKLLDRLEKGGHVQRRKHPSDRRAITIEVTPQTREAAMSTVGRQQAGRFLAAARLSSADRETVTRFVRDMAREISVDDTEWAEDDSAHGGGRY